ncbi:gp53-like domain-containing protein [Xenorhabdus eapokensis]|uniref:Putative tail fiber protein gp53-like C-terminal domain-containing protein n=1 Tax=Xenorhabdus eapokensis TaxID=1873482 RepID=A0A1Q5TQX7_9GAMM|nr:hypothetical protein [Xenorhabdus eapokensis]OKP02633.1 hypothetical protein Xedl_02284 [Xenorhabdus eapokensis]
MERAENALDKRIGGTVNGKIEFIGTVNSVNGFAAGSAALTPWGDIRGKQWDDNFLSIWIDRHFGKKNTAEFMVGNKGWWQDGSSGIIFQYGALGVSGGNFDFPRAFPDECFAMLVTNTDSQGSRIDNAFGYPMNRFQFYAASKTENGDISRHSVAWWAIGR